ncbi:hypothetical protein B0H16DRAFT_1454182 [Mycena metata]|uniref:Uncharacterized protein n=1 Tax=Mycena metata TaxID=1033252 RepID=A0AAD7NL07_9AGAR|nr:hypothetical protein B0H16DRAFT_1454182 [Mycena metata]
MPTPSTPAQARLNNIKTSSMIVLNTLELLANASNLPFLKPITPTAHSLLNLVQFVNKNKCTDMMEQVYEVIHGLIRLHVQSQTGQLSPNSLKTLYKVHTFVEAQQETNRFKQIFRRGKMNALQRDCTAELQHALSIFKLQGVDLPINARQTHEYENQVHQEVLHLIDSWFNEESSVGISTMTQINQVFSTDYNRYTSSYSQDFVRPSYTLASSNSLSLLPSQPKIFYGRESEVSDILKAFRQGTPRIAILGPGGMGKTTLAKAILHCEDIAVLCVLRVCLDKSGTHHPHWCPSWIEGEQRSHSSPDPTLFMWSTLSFGLDNLETLWEQVQYQGAIEEFLSRGNRD